LITYISIGKIGSPYGVHGWLKIQTYTEFGTGILSYSPWYISTGKDTWDPLQIEEAKLHGNKVIAKFAAIHSPEEARLLTGKLIAITRSQLPPLKKNEYYWTDLIGLTVINQHGIVLGNVVNLLETGSNDVLIVNGEQNQAIPYLWGDVITYIDLDKQEIHVHWELI
jgi:16S rRNA processing protein RimM